MTGKKSDLLKLDSITFERGKSDNPNERSEYSFSVNEGRVQMAIKYKDTRTDDLNSDERVAIQKIKDVMQTILDQS